MQLGIDPKVDYAFKHLFGRDATRPLLIDVLDSVLDPAPGHAIRDVELLNPFNPKEALDDKLSVLDIKARDQSGRLFNVEMQMLAFRHYEKRILYYGTRLYQQQLHEGQDYLELKPTLSVSFLDHVFFPQAPEYHLRFQLLETARHFPFTADLEFHVLELPKFQKAPAELASGLDVWLYFLRHAERMDPEALPAALDRPLVRRACEELKMLSQTDQERERYEARRKWQLDYNTGMKVARLEGREEGRREGRLEGEQIGRTQGEQIGRMQGEQIGRIHAYERLLARTETPAEQLAVLSLEELTRQADELQTLLQR
jgi:predicted transposase/invertase (TIGR01784 family)